VHLDCFSGASGNMLLGALLEIGASRETVQAALATLPVRGLRMETARVERRGIAATHVSFTSSEEPVHHRPYSEIRERLSRAQLPGAVEPRSLAVFEKLAVAEARIHGCELDDVHFHELGAVDTLADVVGVCAALESLDVARLSCSAIALGHGCVDTAHGRLPLPAPATIELLRGIPTYPAQVSFETITPTGAALLATLVDEFGAMPALAPAAQGFGAGNDRESAMPNVLLVRKKGGVRPPPPRLRRSAGASAKAEDPALRQSIGSRTPDPGRRRHSPAAEFPPSGNPDGTSFVSGRRPRTD